VFDLCHAVLVAVLTTPDFEKRYTLSVCQGTTALVIVLCYVGVAVTLVWRPAARPLENAFSLLNHALTGTIALLAMFPTAGPIRAKGALTIVATVVSVVSTVAGVVFGRLEDRWTDAALAAAATERHQLRYTEAVTVEVASAHDAATVPPFAQPPATADIMPVDERSLSCSATAAVSITEQPDAPIQNSTSAHYSEALTVGVAGAENAAACAELPAQPSVPLDGNISARSQSARDPDPDLEEMAPM
jgi:hypothetical protein